MRLPQGLSRLIRSSFDRGVRLAALAAYNHPSNDPARYGASIELDVPYKQSGDKAHLLDVYRPIEPAGARATRRPPAVLYVHGGGFSMLSKDTHRIMALSFASRGYVVFNINYRLGPIHTYPAPLEDAAHALLWVTENAARYGADPARIVLAGESAGANLITALTYAATHPRPEPFAAAIYERSPPIRAALPIYGLLDLHTVHRLADRPGLPSWIRREIVASGAAYVGHPVEEKAHSAPLASPLRLLDAPPGPGARPMPPFFVAVGTADPLLDDSRRLKAALDARGVPCELAVYPGEIHGFNAMLWRPAARAKWHAVFRFLDKYAPAHSSPFDQRGENNEKT